jgi:hypothetical protein
MPRMSKIELFAAIRRDFAAGMSGRAIEVKYRIGRRTVSAAMPSALPRKAMPPRGSKLDRFKPAIDEILRADLDAPRKQRHTVRRIYHRLLDEHGMADVSYQVVRTYVADRKPKIRAEAGRGPIKVFFPQTHRPGAEALCGVPHKASYAACGNMRRRARRGSVVGSSVLDAPHIHGCSGCSQSFEEGQEGVGWTVSTSVRSWWRGPGDGLLFEVEVGV